MWPMKNKRREAGAVLLSALDDTSIQTLYYLTVERHFQEEPLYAVCKKLALPS